MAYTVDLGTFEYWITDRIPFDVLPPKSGNTGDFEKWLTDRLPFEVYVEAEEAVRIPRHPATIFQIPALV